MAIGNVMGKPIDVAYRASAAASANVTLPAGSSYLVICDQDCWIAFGGAAVVAAVATKPAIYLPKNTPYVFGKPIVGAASLQLPVTKLAAIRATADGTVTIVGLA